MGGYKMVLLNYFPPFLFKRYFWFVNKQDKLIFQTFAWNMMDKGDEELSKKII